MRCGKLVTASRPTFADVFQFKWPINLANRTEREIRGSVQLGDDTVGTMCLSKSHRTMSSDVRRLGVEKFYEFGEDLIGRFFH